MFEIPNLGLDYATASPGHSAPLDSEALSCFAGSLNLAIAIALLAQPHLVWPHGWQNDSVKREVAGPVLRDWRHLPPESEISACFGTWVTSATEGRVALARRTASQNADSPFESESIGSVRLVDWLVEAASCWPHSQDWLAA